MKTQVIAPALKAGLCIAIGIWSMGDASSQTVVDLDYQLAYPRGIEAVIWSMPAISIREFQEAAFNDYGITWNDVILFSKPVAPRHELLTARRRRRTWG